MIPYMEIGLARLVAECIESSGRKPAEIAQRAAVSNSTISRIVNGRVSPSMETIAEIFAACGQQLVLDAEAPRDPRAAAAARLQLDPSYRSTTITRSGEQYEEAQDLSAWVARLDRWSAGDRVALVKAAADHSGVLRRSGSLFLRGDISMGRIASAGVSLERSWAVSGRAGLDFPGFTHRVPAITVLWCEDVRRMGQLLTGKGIESASAPHRSMVVVAQAEPELFAGTFEHDQITYASPTQIAIDCISVGGSTGDLALQEISTW